MPSLDVTNTTMPLLFGYSHELLNIHSLLFPNPLLQIYNYLYLRVVMLKKMFDIFTMKS